LEITLGLVSEQKKNGTVLKIADIIRAEDTFSSISYWHEVPGGPGRYLWGYGTRASGPGMTISESEANAELIAAIRIAIQELEYVYQFCPSEINEVRTAALVRLMFYTQLPRFLLLTDMNKAIFKGNWSEAAYQLRNSEWYEASGHRARCIVFEIREGDPCLGCSTCAEVKK
jgi:GH24 family phage-related lysozyme (muramidase)